MASHLSPTTLRVLMQPQNRTGPLHRITEELCTLAIPIAFWSTMASPGERLMFPAKPTSCHSPAAPMRTIYAGGVDDFGHLIANQQGELIYESLPTFSAIALAYRVWKTHSDGQYVYFCTLQHLFIYEPNSYTRNH